MDESKIRYRVMAEWGGRLESAAELSGRVRQLLGTLPGPGVWCDLTTGKALPDDSDDLTHWISRFVSRDRDAVYETEGYSFLVGRAKITDGEAVEIELSFSVGREIGGVTIPANQIVIELTRGPVVETTQPVDLTLVGGIVDAWLPDYVTVMDEETTDGSLRPNRTKPKLGYTTWISNRLLTGHLVLDDYEIRDEAGGLLLRLTGDHDASRVIHASAAFAASEAIGQIEVAQL